MCGWSGRLYKWKADCIQRGNYSIHPDETTPVDYANDANTFYGMKSLNKHIWVASCKQREACSVSQRRKPRVTRCHKELIVSPRRFFLKNIHVHANTVKKNPNPTAIPRFQYEKRSHYDIVTLNVYRKNGPVPFSLSLSKHNQPWPFSTCLA